MNLLLSCLWVNHYDMAWLEKRISMVALRNILVGRKNSIQEQEKRGLDGKAIEKRRAAREPEGDQCRREEEKKGKII